MPLRVVYAGTPAFAVPALEALIAGPHEVVAVYTQPDRPAGRGRRLQPSAVKACALAQGLAVEQPPRLDDAQAAITLQSYQPDVLVVAAYGLILPVAILATPRCGALNIHASLLPRWRGAAPIHRAIEAGDSETGVALMEMAPGLDTGPVVAVQSTPIDAQDTTGSVHDRLAQMGAELLDASLSAWAAGQLPATPQSADGVCYAPKLTTAEAWLDWSKPAAVLARQVRAFNPWPVARCQFRGQALLIWQAEPVDSVGHQRGQLGEIVAVSEAGIDVQTQNQGLRLKTVQNPGGKPQAVSQFLMGHEVYVGETLD